MANESYRQKLYIASRIAHGYGAGEGWQAHAQGGVADAQVGNFRAWLTRATLDHLMGQMQQRYPNKAVPSSMLRPFTGP